MSICTGDFVVIYSSVPCINPEIWRWEKHVQQRNLLLIICPEWSRRCGVGESKYLPLHCSVRNIFWILVFCGFSHNFVPSVFTSDFCPVGHLKGEGAPDCPIIKFATQIEMEKLKDCFNVLFNFASSPHKLYGRRKIFWNSKIFFRCIWMNISWKSKLFRCSDDGNIILFALTI